MSTPDLAPTAQETPRVTRFYFSPSGMLMATNGQFVAAADYERTATALAAAEQERDEALEHAKKGRIAIAECVTRTDQQLAAAQERIRQLEEAALELLKLSGHECFTSSNGVMMYVRQAPEPGQASAAEREGEP